MESSTLRLLDLATTTGHMGSTTGILRLTSTTRRPVLLLDLLGAMVENDCVVENKHECERNRS